MALVYVLLASFLIALCQFCILAKAQESGKDEVLMAVRFFISAIICVFAFPMCKGEYHLEPLTFTLALVAGLLQGLLMLYTRKALCLGQSNVSIAVLNSSCIVPPMLMAAVFGKEFNFSYSLLNALGAFLVVFGFFYAARKLSAQKEVNQPNFFKILSIAFLFQVVFLIFLQWKSLNFKTALPLHILLPFQGIEESLWFNAIMFFTCAMFQLCQVTTWPASLNRQDVCVFGILGGFANGFSGVLLLEAIEKANSMLENALLYPLLSIGTVCFCQFLARWWLKEELQWKANFFFLLGILLSSQIEGILF